MRRRGLACGPQDDDTLCWAVRAVCGEEIRRGDGQCVPTAMAFLDWAVDQLTDLLAETDE
ncbi:hypothetical protein [Streptomyces sp. NPDC050988]|uniref:hypothetical protein n=1 Tax=Streptomyces sp. NPDC050988 TaxID=3365637 RepID=UPI0037A4B172